MWVLIISFKNPLVWCLPHYLYSKLIHNTKNAKKTQIFSKMKIKCPTMPRCGFEQK